MKKLVLSLSVAVLAAGFAGGADARPGKGKAFGHHNNGKAYTYAAPSRGYYAAPRYSYRRSNRGAVAAGVAGAIIGGALGSMAQPSYGYYELPVTRSYTAPTRRYYREEYYEDAY